MKRGRTKRERTKRGRLGLYISLILGHNGVTATTRVIQHLCNIPHTTAKEHLTFLEENGFLTRVPHTATRHTFKRTPKGEKVTRFLLQPDISSLLDPALIEIYTKSEEEKTLLQGPHSRPTYKPLTTQKTSILELLQHGDRYVFSRIISYSLATQKDIPQILDELLDDDLITLYPTDHKTSKGEYGITSKGRAFITKEHASKKR